MLTGSLYICFSPGVIITEIHKRGGMDEEAYQKVASLWTNKYFHWEYEIYR